MRFSLAPQHNFAKNSLAFHFVLDQEIANLPVLKNASDVQFTSIAQDGTAASIDVASISTPDLAAAERELAEHFKHLAYREQNQCEPACRAVWVKGNASITMTVEKNRLQVLKASLD